MSESKISWSAIVYNAKKTRGHKTHGTERSLSAVIFMAWTEWGKMGFPLPSFLPFSNHPVHQFTAGLTNWACRSETTKKFLPCLQCEPLDFITGSSIANWSTVFGPRLVMEYGLQIPDYLPVFLKLHLVLNLIFVSMVPTILLYAVVWRCQLWFRMPICPVMQWTFVLWMSLIKKPCSQVCLYKSHVCAPCLVTLCKKYDVTRVYNCNQVLITLSTQCELLSVHSWPVNSCDLITNIGNQPWLPV